MDRKNEFGSCQLVLKVITRMRTPIEEMQEKKRIKPKRLRRKDE